MLYTYILIYFLAGLWRPWWHGSRWGGRVVATMTGVVVAVVNPIRVLGAQMYRDGEKPMREREKGERCSVRCIPRVHMRINCNHCTRRANHREKRGLRVRVRVYSTTKEFYLHSRDLPCHAKKHPRQVLPSLVHCFV